MHVFVSYKHDDYDFAVHVINHLEKAGFQTWADHKIGAGEEWRNAIDLAIKNSFALLVIMTPEAKTSEYVTYEWAFAWGIGIKVIPVMLKKTELHPRLEALQYLDFTNRTVRPWDQLLEEVLAASKIPLDHTISTPLNAPPFIRQAVAALDSASSAERWEALRTLAQSRGPEMRRVFLEALQHPIEDVRLGAALALWVQENTSGTSIFIEILQYQYGSIEQRRQILATLNYAKTTIDSDELMTILLESLQDPEPSIRQLALATLDNVKYSIETFYVLSLLQDSNDEIRSLAAKMLGNIGDPATIPDLSEVLLQTPYSEIHQTIAEALGNIGDPAAIPVLSKILQNIHSYPGGLSGPASPLYESIIVALGKIGDPTTIPLLLKWGLRLQQPVTAALKMMKVPSVMDLLLDFLQDPDFVIRLSTAQVLGDIGTANPVVLEALVEALKDDPDPTVCQSIVETLEKIGDASIIPALDEAFLRYNQSHQIAIRLSIVKALEKLGGADATPTFLAALQDPDPSICQLAVTLLSDIDDTSIIETLKGYLMFDRYQNLRLPTIQILASIGDISVESILRRMSLDDPDAQVRFQAKLAVKKIIKRTTFVSET